MSVVFFELHRMCRPNAAAKHTVNNAIEVSKETNFTEWNTSSAVGSVLLSFVGFAPDTSNWASCPIDKGGKKVRVNPGFWAGNNPPLHEAKTYSQPYQDSNCNPGQGRILYRKPWIGPKMLFSVWQLATNVLDCQILFWPERQWRLNDSHYVLSRHDCWNGYGA